jgi:SAM-dependent methyltransferase
MALTRIPPEALERELRQLDGRLPDAAEFQHLSSLIIDHPEVATLRRLDPFSPAYRDRAMALYLGLRGTAATDYDPTRDEAAADDPQANLWTGLTPWSFHDAGMLGEFLFSWGHILGLLALPAGGAARVLEYGPGSGQLILMLGRLGLAASGVDIDAGVVARINRQAELLGVPVTAEQAPFGEGFGDARFDRIVFFEAFHHAFDFPALLRRLRERLAPGGRLLLCGEPVLPEAGGGVPYPWGPRLDGLSIFCMRRFGWMELGFTHDLLMDAFQRTGWNAAFHPFPACPRASTYVAVAAGEPVPRPIIPRQSLARFLPATIRRPLRRLLRR